MQVISNLRFLDAPGEVAASIRNHDWTRSPLGPPDSWPQSLRSVVSLLLRSKFPMFVAWGPSLGFLYNDPYAEILGAKHPGAIGQPFQEIWSEIWDSVGPLAQRAMAGEASYMENLPLTMRRKDYEEQTWFTFSYSPVVDEQGDVAGMFCACTETTAIVTAGMARTEADRRKDEFLAMLSHELRNPLAPISTASQLLMLSSDPALVHASAGIIARQVRHMTELVDDLLDVSRVTRGLVHLEMEAIHLEEVIGSAVEQVRPQIVARNHALRLRLPETPLHVRGDRTRLTQIFTNLLDNAAKYTPEGGELGISVEVSGPQVTIHVCDTGQGIEPTLLPHIFELFTQADRSPDRTQGGLGIGLALVRSLVGLHGGVVTAASEGKDRGATFAVRLPMIAPPEAATEPRAHRDDIQTPVLDLVVVDDNVDAAETLQMYLETLGHRVRVFHRALEALDAIVDEPPDLSFLDVGLPDISGYALAREIRARLGRRSGVLATLSGYGQAKDHEASRAAGLDFHLVKPLDHSRLLEVLAQVGFAPRRSS